MNGNGRTPCAPTAEPASGLFPVLDRAGPNNGFLQTLNDMTKRSPSRPSSRVTHNTMMTAWRDNPTCVRGPVMAPLRALDWSGDRARTAFLRSLSFCPSYRDAGCKDMAPGDGCTGCTVPYSNNRASEWSPPTFFLAQDTRVSHRVPYRAMWVRSYEYGGEGEGPRPRNRRADGPMANTDEFGACRAVLAICGWVFGWLA